jgi:hypothetical protein
MLTRPPRDGQAHDEVPVAGRSSRERPSGAGSSGQAGRWPPQDGRRDVDVTERDPSSEFRNSEFILKASKRKLRTMEPVTVSSRLSGASKKPPHFRYGLGSPTPCSGPGCASRFVRAVPGAVGSASDA